MRTVYTLWLKPEDYPRFRALFDDVDDTYEEWRARMERKLAPLIKEGIYVERVLIDPDEMADWCRANGRAIDAQARALYPAWIAMQNDTRDE